jgi:hypothetical protein
MSKRFIVLHENGSDYAVFDTKRQVKVASGLFEDEAEDTANNKNKAQETEMKNL